MVPEDGYGSYYLREPYRSEAILSYRYYLTRGPYFIFYPILSLTILRDLSPSLSGPSYTLKLYIYITLGILGLTIYLELVTIYYRNGLFSGRRAPRALISFTLGKSQENGNIVIAAYIRVVSPRPIKSRDKQNTIELLIQPRRSITSNLLRYTTVALDSSASRSQIERLPNIRDEQGQTLVIGKLLGTNSVRITCLKSCAASISNHLRDHLREIVRSHLHQGVTLAELEYQPK
ncbi:hypothetical protein N7539_003233 [Penicillium diatomitis]|uniref:Uncharacterized protein n=1 Tax=Penicillium diatomitis TaxID=2819901 RepID=A0A9X0BZG6_9EURO|nr:uncharacterized protein N7539_003233 [Penicillium diatomitis]KAJ5491666.1 hypothetical protein N7539_003233 [Penicillium diatomitis]